MPDHLQGGGVVLRRAARKLARPQVIHALARHFPAVPVVPQGGVGGARLVELPEPGEPLRPHVGAAPLELAGHGDQQPEHKDQNRQHDGCAQKQPPPERAARRARRLQAERLLLRAALRFVPQRGNAHLFQGAAHPVTAVAARFLRAVHGPAGTQPQIRRPRRREAAVPPVADAELLGKLGVAVSLLQRGLGREGRPRLRAKPRLPFRKVYPQHPGTEGRRLGDGQEDRLFSADARVPPRDDAVAVGQLRPRRRSVGVQREEGRGHALDANVLDDLQRQQAGEQLALGEQPPPGDADRRAGIIERFGQRIDCFRVLQTRHPSAPPFKTEMVSGPAVMSGRPQRGPGTVRPTLMAAGNRQTLGGVLPSQYLYSIPRGKMQRRKRRKRFLLNLFPCGGTMTMPLWRPGEQTDIGGKRKCWESAAIMADISSSRRS